MKTKKLTVSPPNKENKSPSYSAGWRYEIRKYKEAVKARRLQRAALRFDHETAVDKANEKGNREARRAHLNTPEARAAKHAAIAKAEAEAAEKMLVKP